MLRSKELLAPLVASNSRMVPNGPTAGIGDRGNIEGRSGSDLSAGKRSGVGFVAGPWETPSLVAVASSTVINALDGNGGGAK